MLSGTPGPSLFSMPAPPYVLTIFRISLAMSFPFFPFLHDDKPFCELVTLVNWDLEGSTIFFQIPHLSAFCPPPALLDSLMEYGLPTRGVLCPAGFSGGSLKSAGTFPIDSHLVTRFRCQAFGT